MSNKSFIYYQKISKDKKFLIENYNIFWEEKKIRFVCDFEKSVIKTIKCEFSKSKLNGYYCN